jgi:hypothetical protein
MALKLFNPKTRAFVSFNAPSADIPLMETLLLNILIELQVHTELMVSGYPEIVDSPETLRTDVVSN